MLDVITPDEDEAAAAVDRGAFDHGEPRRASTRSGGSQPVAAEAAHHIGGEPDKAEHDDEGDDEPQSERHLRAEQ